MLILVVLVYTLKNGKQHYIGLSRQCIADGRHALYMLRNNIQVSHSFCFLFWYAIQCIVLVSLTL